MNIASTDAQREQQLIVRFSTKIEWILPFNRYWLAVGLLAVFERQLICQDELLLRCVLQNRSRLKELMSKIATPFIH